MKRKILFFALIALQLHANEQAISHLMSQAEESFQQKKFEKAVSCYEKIVALNPLDHSTHFKKGLCYNFLNDCEHALQSFSTAFTLHPKLLAALYNMAFINKKMGNYEQAITFYEKLFELKYNNNMMHFGAAQAYLALGNFGKGLPLFEKGREDTTKITARLLDNENLSGKTILIIEEWGMGDTFQFIRYAKKAQLYMW